VLHVGGERRVRMAQRDHRGEPARALRVAPRDPLGGVEGAEGHHPQESRQVEAEPLGGGLDRRGGVARQRHGGWRCVRQQREHLRRGVRGVAATQARRIVKQIKERDLDSRKTWNK
jgi:hypothetical protein